MLNIKLLFLNDLRIVYKYLNENNNYDTIIKECKTLIQKNITLMHKTAMNHISSNQYDIKVCYDI
jgi:hypothetical protein